MLRRTIRGNTYRSSVSFVRTTGCSRGTVVNLAHAVDFDGTVFQLDDGSRVSVSRDLSKSARQTFMKFLFEKEAKL